MATAPNATTYSRVQLRRLLNLPKLAKLKDVALIAHTVDMATGEAFFEIAFRTTAGGYASVRFGKELRHNPNKVRELVTKFDAELSLDPKSSTRMIVDALSETPPNWWRMAPDLGWNGDRSIFVSPDEVLGKNGTGKKRSDPKFIPPNALANAQLSSLTNAGDLASWKTNVGSIARRSSAATLALSTAFAAPLLSLIDWPTFMIVLYGPGKTGKSTAALVGASVLGIGSEKMLPNWNLTAATIAEVAQCFNDLPLVLNGLETTKMNNKELSEFLKSVTYILGDGIDTRRHSSWSSATSSAEPGTWSTIALVTSEQSFDAIADNAGKKRMEGEQARAIDIPAVQGDNNTIIDRFPKTAPKDPAERKLWARKTVAALRDACAANHGVALQPYLTHLMKQDQDKLRGDIAKARDAFVAKVVNADTPEQTSHAAKNLGVVYAGGLQAIEAGLLPLNEKELLRRLKTCFTGGLAAAAAPKLSPQTRGLAMLKQGLQDAIDKSHTKDMAKLFLISDASGSSKTSTFTVHSAKLFGIWFNDDVAAKQATLQWLGEKQLLDVKDLSVAKSAGYTIDSVRRGRRLQGKSRMCIVFRDPRPDLSAELTIKAS
jgi:putative DNA primase/helicase